MEVILTGNWLTRAPAKYAPAFTIWFSFLLLLGSSLFFTDIFHAKEWMAASGETVFARGEYWRAWTTLFAHDDLGHLLSNGFLFVPLVYFLASHFGALPFLGFLLAGALNLLVVTTMPPQVSLIGVSGMVYWMGAAWLTLTVLIDRRHKLKRRFGGVIFLTVLLFVPETIRPDVSHLSHFLGYVTGVASAGGYYFVYRRALLASETYELVIPQEEFDDWRAEDSA